jgi:hypothetical protein
MLTRMMHRTLNKALAAILVIGGLLLLSIIR